MKRRIRKPIAMAIAGCLICGTYLPGGAQAAVAAQEKSINVQINGVYQQYAVKPMRVNGSVLVPMRAIFEALGAELKWTQATQTVNANKGTDTMELTIGKKSAKINGGFVELNAAPVNANGNTMVPIRFVGEALGAYVNWDYTTQTVVIESDDVVTPSQPATPAPAPAPAPAAVVDPLSANGNANGDGLVAQDAEWIYYAGSSSSQLFKSKKDRSETVKLAEDVVPRFITVAGDWIYFANFELVSSPLYKIRKDGTGLTQVTEESVWYIAKSGSWLVFNMVGENGGLFRLNPNGGSPELIASEEIGVVNADKDWVYYNNRSEGNTFYKIKVDGSQKTKLNDTHVGMIQTVGNSIYYTSIFSLDLFRMDKDGSNDEVAAYGVGPFNVQGDWIYYIDIYDDRKLYKVRTDGTGKTKLSDNSTDNVLLAGDWIFYQNGSDASQMYTLALNGTENQPAYLFTKDESELTKVAVEDFAQEQADRAKLEASLAAGEEIVANRAGKTAEKIADEIVNRLIEPGMSDFEKMKVFHDYLVRNVQYDFENYLNGTVPSESHKAVGAFVNLVAVCDGYSSAMEMLLNKAGIENYHVYGTANSIKGWEGHTWNLVKLGGEYYHIDVTWDDPSNNTSAYTSYAHFLVDDATMSLAHKWNKSNYPAATDSRFATLEPALVYAIKSGDWYYYKDMMQQEQVFRFNEKTLETELVLNEPANPHLISGGYLYYSSGTDANNLYRVKLDGSGQEKLTNMYAGSVHRIGDWFVFASSFSIYKVHKDGGQPVKLSDDVSQGIVVTDEHIYYNTASASNGHIYRINPDGTGKTQIDSAHSIRNFRIDGDWIFFSTIFPEKNGRMKLDGSEFEYFE